MRFTAIVPNEKIEFEAEIGPMRPNCAFIFDQAHAGTSVTFRGDPNPVGPFKLLSPVFAGDLGKSPVSIAEIPQLVERSASRCCD